MRKSTIRLLYVVQHRTGLLLFFRYMAGSVTDVSTFICMIAELKANGVNTKFAVLDGGYYTEVNADAHIDAGVSVMEKMKSSFKGYQRVVKTHLPGLESKENAVLYNNRFVYIKCITFRIGKRSTDL